MAQRTEPAADTAAIRRLIAAARARMRLQRAAETATLSSFIASATALAIVFAVRSEWIAPSLGVALLIGTVAIIAIGAIVGALGRIDDEAVARRIDRASGLADRLSTAIAFRDVLAGTRKPPPGETTDDVTHALMVAAIADGVRAVPRANVLGATPFLVPLDAGPALAFAALCAIVAGIALPQPDRTPHLIAVAPANAKRSAEVHLTGDHFGTAPRAVYLGKEGHAAPIEIVAWTDRDITARIPRDAAYGETEIAVYLGADRLGPLPIRIVDELDVNFHDPDTVAIDADDKAYVESVLAEIKATGQRDKSPDLADFATKVEKLLDDAERGKLTKDQLLDGLKQAEDDLASKSEPDPGKIEKDLEKLGEELAKDPLTKDLGDALEKNDLEKAQADLEKLAEQLDNQQLTEQQKAELANKLAEAAKDLDKQLQQQAQEQQKQQDQQQAQQDKKQDDQQKAEQQKTEQELKQLEQQKQQAKTEQQKQDLDKQIQDKKQELQKQQDKQRQAQQDRKQRDQQRDAQREQQEANKQNDQKQQKQQDQERQDLEDQVERLEKQKQQAKNDQERQDADERLQKKKDELKKLEKQQDEQNKDDSAQKSALKRLERDMQQAADDMQHKPPPDQNKDKQSQQQQDKDKQERERQASRDMKDAARETQRIDQDRRKQATQKKMSSQMDDLREAMRRAKQRGNKGPQDPFGKDKKNQDFMSRAQGKRGSGQSWKPGQGQQGQGQGQGQQGQGQGQGQPGDQGGDAQNGGEKWGTGHDDHLTGDPTNKSGNEKDEDLQGEQGKNGSSRRETIVSAAHKGFASVGYQKVYADYHKIVEDVMRTEKMPSSYKYYVKRYFAKIHPETAAPSAAPAAAPAGDKP